MRPFRTSGFGFLSAFGIRPSDFPGRSPESRLETTLSLFRRFFHLAELLGAAQVEDRLLSVAALLVNAADSRVGG